MRIGFLILGTALVFGELLPAAAQDAKQIVRTAVQTEITASRDDHSRWIYFDVDRKPSNTVRQWVAETSSGDLHRVLAEKGSALTPTAQRNVMERFIHDPDAQARQRKSGEHDDRQSEDMLRLLPDAFVWSVASTHGNRIRLHFTPDPHFKPPSWETRVFAAMEGDMEVESTHHRIVSLRGRLVHDVRFCGGLCGTLSAGGTFDVERRQTGSSVWQIVATHVHIHGTALFFKNISQEEDDEKSRFEPLPGNISLAQAETELLKQNDGQAVMAGGGQ
ncbi:MAG: hypothetical protein WCC26_10530 [Terracidiphilus sp.]